MDLRVVVVAGGQPREVANVDDRRIGVHRARLAALLQRDAGARDRTAARAARRADPRSGGDRGRSRAVQVVGPGHPDLTELLGEALDPAARHGEVLVDPDERAGRDRLAIQQRVDHKVELLVLRARRVEQLIAALGERLPVGEHSGAAPGVRMRLQALGQERDNGLRIGVEVDDEEVADVVPRRWRHETRPAARRTRNRVALQGGAKAHGATSSWTSGASGTPRVSRLSRSEATAASSKRKYERGGNGPQVFDE